MEVIKIDTATHIVEKQRADEQWNKYHATAQGKEARIDRTPSERQIAYIKSLEKIAGLRIDVDRIDSTSKASSLIENLKMLGRLRNGFSNGNELRDKKVAFGMATKLVFKRYLDKQKDYRNSKSFWKEVMDLYNHYQEKQEAAIKSPSLESVH